MRTPRVLPVQGSWVFKGLRVGVEGRGSQRGVGREAPPPPGTWGAVRPPAKTRFGVWVREPPSPGSGHSPCQVCRQSCAPQFPDQVPTSPCRLGLSPSPEPQASPAPARGSGLSCGTSLNPDSSPAIVPLHFPPRTGPRAVEPVPCLGSQLNLVPPIVLLGPQSLVKNFPRFPWDRLEKAGWPARHILCLCLCGSLWELPREYWNSRSWPGRSDPPRPEEDGLGRGGGCPLSLPPNPPRPPLPRSLPTCGPRARGGGRRDHQCVT